MTADEIMKEIEEMDNVREYNYLICYLTVTLIVDPAKHKSLKRKMKSSGEKKMSREGNVAKFGRLS